MNVASVIRIAAANAKNNDISFFLKKYIDIQPMDVFKVYKNLLKKYGPQGWWPILSQKSKSLPAGRQVKKPAFRQAGLKSEIGLTYGTPYSQLEKCRTSFHDPYFEIAVGAILTQNTAWKNVAKAIANLYKAKALTPARILKISQPRLCNLIKPAGYYNQKCKKLKLFCEWLVEEFGGNIRKLKRYALQTARSKLLEQWGIGKETADSILLYALNKPIFVVDEYTRRLCRRHGVEFNEYDEYRDFFEKRLSSRNRTAKICQEFHALIVADGKENK